MSATRRPGQSDLRGAVSKALGVGVTKAEAVARPEWWCEAEAGGYVASDYLVEMFITVIAVNIKTSLKKGGMVTLQSFGTFYVGRHYAHIGRGVLANRYIFAGKDPCFRSSGIGWEWPGFPV